ncbi:MAG: site-2 protease family protein [bacterium]|nr:site-2 protease family protein [bacterium]
MILLQVFVLLLAVVIHEFAHGWMAYKCGDSTARDMGRLTLNPIPHIDLNMTIIMPILIYMMSGGRAIFGGAKPVPINPNNFRNPKRDMILVSLAGCASNFVAAILFALLIRLGIAGILPAFTLLCVYGVLINILLGVFNLIPIPPLDGSKILMSILPYKQMMAYLKFERFGFILIIFFLFLGGFGFFFKYIILPLVSFMTDGLIYRIL